MQTIVNNLNKKDNITGIILAGGKSIRMGTNKALIAFNGKSFIEFSTAALSELCETLIISGDNAEYQHLNLPQVSDNYSNIGPIAGLEACLRYSKTQHNLVVPCDSPFLNSTFLKSILSEIDNYDAIVPISSDGKVEPLIGYYSKDVWPIIVNQIAKGDYKMMNLLQIIKTKYALVVQDLVFNNINTPEELKNLMQKEEKS